MGEPATIARVLKQDRWIVGAGLLVVCGLSWLYLVVLAREMGDMSGMASMAPSLEPWSAADWFFMFVMWAVMMVAMMTPSATPMILLFAGVNRREDSRTWRTAVFVAGYLMAWTLFSVAATLIQWGLERVALLSPTMVTTSRVLGGGLLLACALYQFSPWKSACLDHCRSPLQFVMHHWRTGTGGAFRMGLEHGFYCIGCCWLLMTLLFVGGVMNLLWIAGLGGFVLLEKVTPWPELVSRVSGLVFLVAGVWLLIA